MSQSPSKCAAGCARPTGGRSRSWSRLTSGVWLRVLGAVPYGTAPVCSTIVPPCEAQAWRPSLPQGLAPCRKTEPEGVRVVERRGRQRAHKLDARLDHDRGTWRCHCFPAPWGPHLTPRAGWWRGRQEAMGAGRGCCALPQLYQRTRRVLMAPPECPIEAFRWSPLPPQTSRNLLRVVRYQPHTIAMMAGGCYVHRIGKCIFPVPEVPVL